MTGTHIDVVERGETDIDAATFTALSSESSFWTLVDQGIIRIGHASRGKVRLHGGRYVGTAVVGDTTLNLVEKIPGGLAALISSAAGNTFRVVQSESHGSPTGPLLRLLVRSFLECVGRYASDGIDFRYARRRELGSVVGGALDMPRTIQARARGMRHVAAFSRPMIDRGVPKNRVILAALRQVEALAGIAEIPAQDVAAARTLAQFFTDSQDAEVLFARRDYWVDEARTLAEGADDTRSRDLLALAAVVLAHQSLETGAVGARAPRAWFLNLEDLFESAVRRTLDAAVSAQLKVRATKVGRPAIFSAISGYLRADPDIVIKSVGKVRAVGDAKYKKWGGLTTGSLHPDLYQLLVHARAFGADMAFLVYPHDTFESQHLGTAATGADTWLFAVDIRDLEAGLSRAATLMGIAAGEACA